MVSPPDYSRPNGRAGGRSRRSPPLTRQQRLWVSVVAAALGLLFAWVMQGGGRRHRHATRAAVEEADLPGGRAAAQQRVNALLEAAGAGHLVQQPGATQQQQQQQGGGDPDGGAIAAGAAAAAAAAGKAQAQQQLLDAQVQATARQQAKGQQQAALAAEQKPQQASASASAQLPGMEDEREWFNKLSSEACARAEQLRVCSHRGRLAVEGVPPGSLSAYSVLHKGGVSCYDIDFVQTRDGQLVASHPDDLQAALAAGAAGQAAGGPPPLGQWSLAELRAAGADEERFPTADALIKVFAALLEQSGLLWKPGQGQHAPDYEQLPVLLMDLKGEAYNPDTINSVAAAAAAVDAEAHVALFVAAPQQLVLVLNQTRWGGPLIRGYMDRDDANPALPAEELEPFALLGPSIKMADSFFAAAAQLGKPVLAWTVDSPRDLHRALEANLNAAISNRPLAVRGVLLDWRDRCSERQGRLKAERRQRRRQRRALEGQAAARRHSTGRQLRGGEPHA